MIPAGLATILALLLQVSTITVKGQVLNGQTREPLSGVEVYFGAAGKRMMSTATDGEGRFSLAVPEGTYSVSLKKPGYVPPRAAIPIGSEETGSVGLIDVDDASPELHFKMIRGGVITGRVFEPDGRPAAQKRVSLKQRSYDENGVPSMSIIAGSTVIDDRGEYRFFGIESGDYYLSADSVAERSDLLNLRAASAQRDPPNVFTYYPGVMDLSEALQIHLQSGAELRLADMSVKTGVSVPVQLHIQNSAGFKPRSISVEILKNHTSLVRLGFSGLDPSNKIDLNPLSPGDYECLVTLIGTDGSLSGISAFHVEGASAEVTVTVGKGWTVRAQVDLQDGNSLTPVSGVSMVLSMPGHPASSYEASDQNGAIVIRGVFEGLQRIRFLSLPQGTYVASIRADGTEISAEGIRVSGDTTIHVTLRTQGGSIHGSLVNSRHEKIQFGLAVLVPDDPNRFMNYYLSDSSENGLFGIRDIAPGDYRLYAWQDLPGAAYLNSEFMANYRSKGQPVRIQASDDIRLNEVQIQ